ncbi:histidine kinase, partial [Streptomyces hydrogenans]
PGRAPAPPRPLPRPVAVRALAPGSAPSSAPAPVPAGVTALRPRGHALPPQAPPDRTGHGPGDAGADDGLPRRIRQASLVPQLREAPAPDPVPAPAVPGVPERTPERVRDRMAAYRDGWQRGGGPAPGVRRPLGDGAPAAGAPRPVPVPGTRPYGDSGPTGPHQAPYDPRSDARARTDLGPYFGARPTPAQDPRPEGDDA